MAQFGRRSLAYIGRPGVVQYRASADRGVLLAKFWFDIDPISHAILIELRWSCHHLPQPAHASERRLAAPQLLIGDAFHRRPNQPRGEHPSHQKDGGGFLHQLPLPRLIFLSLLFEHHLCLSPPMLSIGLIIVFPPDSLSNI